VPDISRIVEKLVTEEDAPLLFSGVELGLQIWNGEYENHEDGWLRWRDASGQVISTGAEAASNERNRADWNENELKPKRFGQKPRNAVPTRKLSEPTKKPSVPKGWRKVKSNGDSPRRHIGLICDFP